MQSLWDTIFPPGTNDGNLNISEEYLPEPYNFQSYMYSVECWEGKGVSFNDKVA